MAYLRGQFYHLYILVFTPTIFPLQFTTANWNRTWDDSKILLSFAAADVDGLKQQLEEDLYLIAKCRSENELLINPGKTKYMLIGTRQNLQQLPEDMSINFLNEVIPPFLLQKI